VSFGVEAGCLIGNLAIDGATLSDALRERVDDVMTEWTDRLAVAVHRHRGEAGPRPGRTDLDTARFLVAAWEGVVLRAKVTRDHGPLDDFLAHLPTLIDRQPRPAKPSRRRSIERSTT
jgi:TetR/AcrR family transcriptional regulator, transcriptional repressor for nem operon